MGLISTIGVPSMASRGSTCRVFPAIFSTVTRCRPRGGGLHHVRLDSLHPLETLMEHKSPRCPYVHATSTNTPQPAGAAVAHSCGRPLAPPDRLVRALPALRRLALSPGLSDHTPPSRPSSRAWVRPSTASMPGQRWTTPAGPCAWSATKMSTALSQPLALSMAPHAPFPREQVASGVQARSTVVQGVGVA